MNEHDHGDEDRRVRHVDRGHLTEDQVDYLLAIGGREAGYMNWRSRWHGAESVHARNCNLTTKAGYFCSCVRGYGRPVPR